MCEICSEWSTPELVLEPLLSIAYSSQLTKSILHGKVHMYADDFQLYFDTAAVIMNEDLNRLAFVVEKHAM